jgi:hypothetical protein
MLSQIFFDNTAIKLATDDLIQKTKAKIIPTILWNLKIHTHILVTWDKEARGPSVRGHSGQN